MSCSSASIRVGRRAPEQLVAVVVDAGIGKRDAAVDFAGDHRVGVVGQQRVAGVELHVEPQVVAALARRARPRSRSPSARRSGVQRRLADAGGGHALQPDGLPDAGGARVPDRVRLELPVLLAARLGEVVRVVLGADDDGLRALGIEVRR